MLDAVRDGRPRAAKDVSMAGIVGTTAMLAEACGCAAELDVAADPAARRGAPIGDWLTCFPGFAMVTAGSEPLRAGAAVSASCGRLGEGTGVRLRWPDGAITTALGTAATGLGPASTHEERPMTQLTIAAAAAPFDRDMDACLATIARLVDAGARAGRRPARPARSRARRLCHDAARRRRPAAGAGPRRPRAARGHGHGRRHDRLRRLLRGRRRRRAPQRRRVRQRRRACSACTARSTCR